VGRFWLATLEHGRAARFVFTFIPRGIIRADTIGACRMTSNEVSKIAAEIARITGKVAIVLPAPRTPDGNKAA
jgi:hypothetical protein